MALRYHCRNAYADALQSQTIITNYELRITNYELRII